MAQDITDFRIRMKDFVPVIRVLVADATATTTTQGDLGAALYRTFRAFVASSSYTPPDGNAVASAGSTLALEVSNSSNFDAANSAVYTVDSFFIPAAIGANKKISVVLNGTVPVSTLFRYTRIVANLGTNGAINYDAVIEAA